MRTYTLFLEYFATGEGLLRQLLVVNAASPEEALERFRDVFYGAVPSAWDHFRVDVDVHEGLAIALLEAFLAPRVVERLRQIHEYTNEFQLHWHHNLS